MDEGESPEEVARREFMEELGSAPAEQLRSLGEIRQRGGKRVHAFAVEGDIDVATIASNTFELEWPPKSGRLQTFPEVDRAESFDLESAHTKIRRTATSSRTARSALTLEAQRGNHDRAARLGLRKSYLVPGLRCGIVDLDLDRKPPLQFLRAGLGAFAASQSELVTAFTMTIF